KLPSEVVLRLEENFDGDKWDVKTLRDRLQRHLSARQLAEGPSTTPKHKNDFSHAKGNSSSSSTLAPTTGALSAGSKEKHKGPKCVFCKGAHWSENCMKYSTLDERKAQMKGQCFRCLKPGHVAKQCDSTKACHHCKQKWHHSALCPKKFGSRLASNEASQVASENVTQPSPTVTGTPEGHLLAGGEITILQTAQAEVVS